MDEARKATVLLVEDNPDHAMLAMKAFKKGNLTAEVFWVKDGQEALDFLARHGQWAEPGAAPRPGLILLDIHLPKVNGHEVLRQIKNDPSLRTIPVVMLTTSAGPDDLAASYGLGANSYVTKPVSAKIFVDHLESLKLYWLFTNAAPAA
jgi:CheY-like chemotaxis protein